MVGFYHFLAFTEYTLFKCCLVYLWSLAASHDHDFVAAFLQIFNIFFCTMLILSSIFLGYAHGSSTYVPLSGLQVLELVDNTPWNILMIVLLIINVTGFLSIRIKKWIERRRDQVQVFNPNSYNNRSFNISLTSVGQGIFYMVVNTLVALIHRIIMFFTEEDQMSSFIFQWKEISLHTIAYLIIPCMFYSYKKDFRSFVKDSLFR